MRTMQQINTFTYIAMPVSVPDKIITPPFLRLVSPALFTVSKPRPFYG